MHIAFLTPEFPHEQCSSSGGLGTSLKNLVTGLVAKNVRVSVVLYGQEKSAEFIEDGVEFYFLKNQKYKFGGWYKHRKWIQNFLNNLISEKKIDLIEAPDWTGITAFMKFNIPILIRLHGSDGYFCHLEGRKQKFKNRLFEKMALKNAFKWVSPTKYALETTKSVFNINKEGALVIPYCLDTEEFVNRDPKLFEAGLILYVGTVIRKKGVFELPGILKELQKQNNNHKLVIIGADSKDIQTDNSSTWELLQQEFKLNRINNVEYLGKKKYSEVKEFISMAHICIFPSYAETLGMVTIESMAMQKAVVNTNIGWAQELIDDGENGFLVHPADHQLFASRILGLLNDNQLTFSIGKAARKQVIDKFSKDIIVRKNIQFYGEIISNSK